MTARNLNTNHFPEPMRIKLYCHLSISSCMKGDSTGINDGAMGEFDSNVMNLNFHLAGASVYKTKQ